MVVIDDASQGNGAGDEPQQCRRKCQGRLLDNEQPDEPFNSGTERPPRRDLLPPGPSSRQHNVADVQTADGQHEQPSDTQQRQRRADVADQIVLGRTATRWKPVRRTTGTISG